MASEAVVIAGKSAGSLAISSTAAVRQVPASLTAREVACLQMLANGFRPVLIAQELKLANVTVEMHLRNARRKLTAATTAHAVANALRLKLIS